MAELTKKQKEAIKELESAIVKLGRTGIKICGIDDDILYATKEAIDTTPDCGKNYCQVADALQHYQYSGDNIVGSIKTGNIYQDSGGW